MKAEEEVARSEERRSSSQSHGKPGRFHRFASSDKSLLQQSRKSSVPAWKQIRERQQSSKGCGKASTFSQKPAKGSKSRKLETAARRSVSPDGTYLRPEYVGLEPVSWSTRSGFSIVPDYSQKLITSSFTYICL